MKAQIWSADAVISITVFTLVFIVLIIAVWTIVKPSPEEALVRENDALAQVLVAREETSFLTAETLDVEAFMELANLSYDDAKRQLGVQSDFCIHFEDTDGNLILVENISGIGSSDINLTWGGQVWACNGSKWV